MAPAAESATPDKPTTEPAAPLGRVEAPRPASQARIEANRRNALRSTGPKTDVGKRKARVNALKHGLAALSLKLGDDDERREAVAEALAGRLGVRPGDLAGELLCDQAAHASVQFERASAMVRVAAQTASIRAEDVDAWSTDRRADAAKVALRLSTDPAGTVGRLMGTAQGLDWLIDRWRMLRFDARSESGWRDVELSFAMDLLAIPADFRWLGPVKAFNEVHRPEAEVSSPAELSDAVLRNLEAARDAAADLDEVDRLATVHELTDRFSPEVRRLRRYESAHGRRFRWLVDLARSTAPAQAQNEANPIAPEIQNEAKPVAAEVQNEANPAPGDPATEPDAEEKAPLPPPAARVDPPQPAIPPPHPAKKHRPDPARLARQARRRRKAA